jgi:hypothetical protein
MSSVELSKTRKQLNEVKLMVRKGRILPAVQALHNGLQAIMRTSLIKNERSELEALVSDAVSWLSNSKEVREKFPLAIEYTPGEEDSLAEITQQLLELLEGEVHEQATESLKLLEERRNRMLAEAQKFLDKQEVKKRPKFTTR